MASYLQIENISKSYGSKVLFEHIGFNINEGDKIALVAPNGTGKTSLMRILAGKDKSDSGGKILFLKDIRIAFLEQEYEYNPDSGIFDQIMNSSSEYTQEMDNEHLWEYERRVKKFLTSFGLNDLSQKMKELSGGGVKRVALSQMLATEADFYIMDEPTNHLDIDAIEFLENHLSRSRCTLLMVTHDRYFLDKVCNTVMEMDRGAIYTYKGNYQNYLEKREERIANYNAETDKVRNILRRELEWMRSTPCARTGKARYRINAFYQLSDRASQEYSSKSIDMSSVKDSSIRLGTKIINCKNLSFYFENDYYLDKFTYNFQRGDKLGIVGRNGVGKSTFIDILTGELEEKLSTGEYTGQLSGSIERGESIKIGYYHQNGMDFNPNDTVLDIVNDTRLLGRFLFSHDMLNNKVAKLSGGEKRRLYLLTILMKQPNVLILDEPTNDLDIVSLNILEDYLKEYQGSLIIVSHDRHFLDKLVDHLFIFCGDGVIKDFVGTYSEYREYIKEYEKNQKLAEINKAAITGKSKATNKDKNKSDKAYNADKNGNGVTDKSKSGKSEWRNAVNEGKRKMSFKEKMEMEQTEKELETLSQEKMELEESINQGLLDYTQLGEKSKRIGEIISLIEEKEFRLLELYDLES